MSDTTDAHREAFLEEFPYHRGWPHSVFGNPSRAEIRDIVSVHGELSLQEPTLDEHRRWHLAGQIVARIRRDSGEDS